jgi:hypothetical protein
MSRSRWSQWVIAESATAQVPMPWDRKTRIRHRRGLGLAPMMSAYGRPTPGLNA